MTVLTFPSNPTNGQRYAAPNGIQYVFDGVKWIVETTTSSSEAVSNSTQDRVAPMFVDGDNTGITFTYNAETNTLAATVTAVNGDQLVSGDYTLLLNSNSDLTVPGTIKSAGGTSYIDIYDSNVILQSSQGFTWRFDPSGIVRTGNTFTKTTSSGVFNATPAVVWTATEDYVSGVKLTIQVEANETGDSSGWHSQVCEAIIASRGYAGVYGGPGGEPQMTVYGVTHTSVAPLVTFTVQRNPTTKKIEVVGTLTAAVNPVGASLRIYSVETATRD